MLAIWLAARPSGVDLSPRIYYVMGPLLFLVMLIPFTINGLRGAGGVLRQLPREASASTPTRVRTGFLFFLVTLAAVGAGRRRSSAGRAARRRRAAVPDGSTSRRGRHLQRDAVGRAVPRVGARRTRRSSSTTARPTGRSSSCASGFPEAVVVEQANVGLGGGYNAGMRAAARAATSCS